MLPAQRVFITVAVAAGARNGPGVSLTGIPVAPDELAFGVLTWPRCAMTNTPPANARRGVDTSSD